MPLLCFVKQISKLDNTLLVHFQKPCVKLFAFKILV